MSEANAQPPVADVPALLALLRRSAAVAGASEGWALSFYRGKTLDGRLDYPTLVERVHGLAGALHARFGVRGGDRVAILAPNRLEIPVLVLALLRLGAVVVPLNPGSPVEDWVYILGHCGARGLCVSKDLAARIPDGARPSFTIHVEDLFALESAPAPEASALAEAMAVVLYTSGTTGAPKGVVLRQRNLIANAWSMAQNFRLDRTTQLAVLPLYHAHAFGFGLMTSLVTGGHLVFAERMEPFTWATVVAQESVAVSSVVPTLLPALLAAGVTHEKVPTLRALLVSSAPLPVDLARDFVSRTRIRLVQGWGLSEYTNFGCCMPSDLTVEAQEQLLFGFEVPSIGPALEGVEVRVAGSADAAVGEDVRGELMIRGPSTMRGYFEDPEQTAHALTADGWLHTGDEGFFRLHHGQAIFFVTGRIKEIIIRDAEKYSPLRIERRVLEALPEWSGRLVVLGFPHRDHGEEIGAYVEAESVDEATRARLLAAIQAMPVAERPKVVLHGTTPIPRTHTGKVQRRRMHAWFSPWVAHRGKVVVEALAAG